ncbi:MAG TPA: DUF2262 domain-containing protein [Polyangiaceae bacterium]|nr:DUF2262 domain-containing protein [Polyangiaceae bacterium]
MTKIVDTLLGVLEQEPEERIYSGVVPTAAGLVKFRLDPDGETFETALSDARSLVENLESYLQRAKARLVTDLLAQKNDVLSENGSAALSEAEFRRRVTVQVVEIYGGGASTFFFADDDLFGGRPLIVSIDCDGVPRQARLG